MFSPGYKSTVLEWKVHIDCFMDCVFGGNIYIERCPISLVLFANLTVLAIQGWNLNYVKVVNVFGQCKPQMWVVKALPAGVRSDSRQPTDLGNIKSRYGWYRGYIQLKWSRNELEGQFIFVCSFPKSSLQCRDDKRWISREIFQKCKFSATMSKLKQKARTWTHGAYCAKNVFSCRWGQAGIGQRRFKI